MSGPTAASFGLDAGLLVAFEAMRAAAAIAEAHAEEAERQIERREQRQAERQRRVEATLAGRRAQAEALAREQALRRQRAAIEELAAAHRDDLGLVADLSSLAGGAPTLAEQLSLFEAQARLVRQLPAAVAAERRALVERVIERAAAAPGAVVPEALEALAAELIATPSETRAAALAAELRLRVDRHNEATAARAAALVLEQSLADLGYLVEGIAETLFVEGGVAHFQKSGWQDHFVRLRVDAKRRTVNFNVVRAGLPGEDRGHEDMLAEERWCAEFPRLRETLAARGLKLAVTRMLAAGEVPVQVVDADSLPRFETTDGHERATPRTMHRS
jgi:hypothetical protein